MAQAVGKGGGVRDERELLLLKCWKVKQAQVSADYYRLCPSQCSSSWKRRPHRRPTADISV